MKTRQIEYNSYCPFCNIVGFQTHNKLLQHIKKSHSQEYKNKRHNAFKKLKIKGE